MSLLRAGAGILAQALAVREVYENVFTAPTWEEPHGAGDAFLDRLARDTERPGFDAVLAVDGTRVLGFATTWITPDPFPAGRCYPQVAAMLGSRRARKWLCGGREVDELAVHSEARGRGIGAALLAAAAAPAADGRCWLLTSARATAAVGFYRRLGWRQATHPAPGGAGAVVFLNPAHPAVRSRELR
ncbi:GNAT family N-acetyltransferase [Streptomyces mashuensis]|uniref:GNAT family N-acetyltransferase n=1 Tax=Streptomyces mashuensis TaxID=33904 RepID=UPI00167CA0BF|nr:GNAT family N-acetyltransferase [Streptomyces mashuensis]